MQTQLHSAPSVVLPGPTQHMLQEAQQCMGASARCLVAAAAADCRRGVAASECSICRAQRLKQKDLNAHSSSGSSSEQMRGVAGAARQLAFNTKPSACTPSYAPAHGVA